MFAELLFVFFAFVGLVMIDNFSTSLGIITCGVAAYFYSYCRLRVLERDIIDSFLISRFFCGFSCCFLKGKTIYLTFKNTITSSLPINKENVPVPSSSTSCTASQYCGDAATLETEIKTIVFDISQQYIHSWYDKLCRDEDFVCELNSIIKDTLVALCSGISKLDRKKFSYLILQIYLHFFTHFVDVQKEKSEKAVWEKFKMKHWATKDSLTEWCYLQSLISALLDSFGPIEYHNSLNSKSSPLLHTVVVEILTENVMYPLINVLTDSKHLNSWLLKLLLNNLKVEHKEIGINIEDRASKADISSLGLFPDSKVQQDDACVSTPRILLSTDDSISSAVTEQISDCTSNIGFSRNALNIPVLSDNCILTDKISDVSSEVSECDIENSFEHKISHLLYFPTGLRSRSNVNLLGNEFSSEAEVEETSSVFYDGSTIKRSRSADYIRQMPHMDGLMPLNTENYAIRLQDRDNKMFVAFKYDINSTSDVEEAEEAIEIELPPLFTDVKITSTQQQVETGLLPYTLYCIQYSGIFHDTKKTLNTPELVKQVVCIKRRFREFLALQSRLEDNLSLRMFLKGIKGPSKWLATPFSNLDKKNISERRSFLESYLQELCNQDAIAKSSELQEFLAYGGDASIAFVKKAADISVPRIDKILFRGVKGALDLFRTALPIPPSEAMPFREPSNIYKPLVEETNSEHRFQDHALHYNSRESEMQEHIRNYFKYFDENSSSESVYDSSRFLEESSKRSLLIRHMCDLNAEESCKCTQIIDIKGEAFSFEKNSFGNAIVDLLMESLQNSVLNTTSFVSLVKILCSSSVNCFIEKKLDEISEEKFAMFLHVLHKSLWSDGKSETNDQNPIVATDVKKNIKECLEVFFTSNYVTKNLRHIFKKTLMENIDFLLASVEHQQLNRCLLFHIFDVIVESMCSKEK